MTLTACWDLSAADWIVHSDLPWDRLVCFGPAGFDSYARLRFLPDPARNGQSENDVKHDGRPDPLPALLEVLAAHTATPDDCYFCVWEGFGDTRSDAEAQVPYGDPQSAGAGLPRNGADVPFEQPGARPGLAPDPLAPPAPAHPPKVVVPHRAFWLFRGPLADVGSWDTAEDWPGTPRFRDAEPAFIWPADRAWCVACDVDPHWAGIGGMPPLITQLIAAPRLDVVAADPDQKQPFYR